MNLDIDEVVVKLSTKLSWNLEDLGRRKFGNFIGCTKGELLYWLIKFESIPDIANHIGCSDKPINNAIKELLLPVFGKLQGGGQSWRYTLLLYAGYHWCSLCKEYKATTSFHKSSCNPSGFSPYCLECKKIVNHNNYLKDSTKEAHKRSYEKHREAKKARNALYRAQRNLRAVSWADKVAIALIYKNCPEGYHVDHHIPMKGELVSGLHTENNLIYLPADENIRKNNSFDIDKYSAGETWWSKESSIKKPDDYTKRIKRVASGKPSKRKQAISIKKTCIVCSKEFDTEYIITSTCGKRCAGILANKDNTLESRKPEYTKEFIEKLIWDKPLSVGCKDVGLSDNGLKKMALRLNCVMPPYRFHVKSEKDKQRLRLDAGIA